MTFKDLKKIMKQHGYVFGRNTEKASDAYKASHFEPKSPHPFDDDPMPRIFYNLKTRKIFGYTDDNNKQNKAYDKLTDIINEYYLHMTGKRASDVSYTPINNKTLNRAMNHAIKLMTIEIKEKKNKK